MKRYKFWIAAIAVVILCVIAIFAFKPDYKGENLPLQTAEMATKSTQTAMPQVTLSPTEKTENKITAKADIKEKVIQSSAEKEPEKTPEPQVQEKNKKTTCTLSVSCDTVLKNINSLAEDKRVIVPANGIIFPETSVEFYDGESVFNVLLREMKRNKIHLEYSSTPIYNSAYIEGIGNIYEFDCGGLSGWMYSVNGQFPNYGSSRYKLKDGDVIKFVYTCDKGRDIGGYNDLSEE